jgi:hypothetical protein
VPLGIVPEKSDHEKVVPTCGDESVMEGEEALAASGPAQTLKVNALALTVGTGFTVIVPTALTDPQPPMSGMA